MRGTGIQQGTFVAALLLNVILLIMPVLAQDQNSKCDGKYKSQKSPSPDELNQILKNHKEWLREFDRRNTELKLDPGGLSSIPPRIKDVSINDPRKANLCQANLRWTTLLENADLREADLSDADLQESVLNGTHLERASLTGTILINASLRNAFLMGAHILHADLRGVDLTEANLKEAQIIGGKLEGAFFPSTIIDDLIFEPDSESLPNFIFFSRAVGLPNIRFHSPHAVSELQEKFKKEGMRDTERQITFSMNRTLRSEDWGSKNNIWRNLRGAANYIAFEITCGYGLFPGRPLLILFGVMLGCTFIYFYVLLNSPTFGAIWLVGIPDRINKNDGPDTPIRVEETFLPDKLWVRIIKSLWIALYFSALSTFQIGWRELNVGNWISRMQPREYILRSTGWVRTISGFQAVLGVYMLALSVLTYFGNPFAQ